jgi:DNA repair exonuclease SbcCD nuclease subunit
MRLAHAADIHLGHRQYGLKQRAVDARLSFQHFLSAAASRDADAIVIPGDLFDSRDVRPETLQAVERLLEAVTIPVIVSPGNHDQNMSRRRNLTWLEYLNDRGLITLLSAELGEDGVTFERTDPAEPRPGGGGYVDLVADDELVRCFGLQYRGAYVERELAAVATAIREVNEREETPDATVLLAHFGVENAVPDLGANLSRAALTELERLVEYIALGHIHKQFESGDVAYNPGSLEAFDVQEGRWEDRHGFYLFDTETGSVDHSLSKRRPYHTVAFDVTGYHTFADLRRDFEATLEAAEPELAATCDREIHRDGQGNRRAPIVNVRFEGTLLLDHAAFDVDALSDLTADRFGALSVQPTDHTERQAVQELLGDLDREEAFAADGSVNTAALQRRVFETLASESRYSDAAAAVAETLDRVEGLVNEDDEDVAAVAEYLQERRRELFPEDTSASQEETSQVTLQEVGSE